MNTSLVGCFFLVTDHNPLTTMLYPEIPPLPASRIQHWATIMSTYNYYIEFCRTHKTEMLMDCLAYHCAVSLNEGRIWKLSRLHVSIYGRRQKKVNVSFVKTKPERLTVLFWLSLQFVPKRSYRPYYRPTK